MSVDVDPFFTQQEFPGLAKRYVSGDHPSASDSNSGVDPSRPYRTLQPVQSIAPGTAVIVAPCGAGYSVPDGGLSLRGASGAPSLLVGAPGEPRPVIDARPFSSVGQDMPTRASEIRVRQVIDVSGAYCRVERLDVRHGFRHNVVFRGQYGGLMNCVLDGAFEDSIKVANTVEDTRGADHGYIAFCDVEGFASQGVDFYGAAWWIIKNNAFHHPQPDPVTGVIVANAVGLKGGAHRVDIVNNYVYGIPGTPERGAIVVGGAGDNFFEAVYDCVASGNSVSGYAGPAFMLSSSRRCSLVSNTVADCLAGVHVGIDPAIRASVPNLPTCSGISLSDNSVAITERGYVIRLASEEDRVNFSSARNRYYGPDRFALGTEPVTHAQFVAWTGTDETSTVTL